MARNFLPRLFDYSADREALDRRLSHISTPDPKMELAVRAIVERVRRRGARALVEYAAKFDGVKLSAGALRIPESRLKKAWESQPRELQSALRLAKNRIEAFHRKQVRKGFTLKDASGARMEQRVLPLQSVGVYVPGGSAAYPSTVLMNVIPARVAGVKRIVAVTPPLGGRRAQETILAAAWLAGVREMYQVGGAQAIAALAFGADPIPAVDKVTGPGNIWVATAKRLLYGIIDIDMVAGPTEVLVLADATAAPNTVAADLLAQAEHDPGTSAWAALIGKCDVDALLAELRRQTETAPRRAIIEQSLRNNGAIVRLKTRAEAVELANRRAPEHLQILTRNPAALARKIHSAGAIFLGPWTPEPIGDYVAGPNHTLPTGRTARFFSALSVDDFTRHDHVVTLNRNAFAKLAPAAIAIAEAEGLYAHAQAVKERMESGF